MPYVNWVGKIGKQFADSMERWALSLAEKNVLSSDLFLNFYYLELLFDFIQNCSLMVAVIVGNRFLRQRFKRI